MAFYGRVTHILSSLTVFTHPFQFWLIVFDGSNQFLLYYWIPTWIIGLERNWRKFSGLSAMQWIISKENQSSPCWCGSMQSLPPRLFSSSLGEMSSILSPVYASYAFLYYYLPETNRSDSRFPTAAWKLIPNNVIMDPGMGSGIPILSPSILFLRPFYLFIYIYLNYHSIHWLSSIPSLSSCLFAHAFHD